MRLRYILFTLVLCVLVGVACAWPASMGAWDYRKEITVNNTGANLTNYQLMFTVNRSAGSDSGFTVYLDGKCESDYDDIRFTTGENTPCDYWIESNSSTVASIWVEVPSIVNSTAYGSNTMYLYYGNSAASAVSNGTNTFSFFDDFIGGSLDSTKWDTTGGGTISISDNEITLTRTGNPGDTCGIVSKNNVNGADTLLSLKLKAVTISATSNSVRTYVGNRYSHNIINYGGTSIDRRFLDEGVAWSSQIEVLSLGTYYIFETNYDGATLRGSRDRGAYTTWSRATAQTDQKCSLIAVIASGAPSTSTMVCDWIFVRKYTTTEPTISVWGSEEYNTQKYLTVDFSGVPTSGYVPLTVYFTDASIGYNVTLNTWAWSFGDSSANSTQQNPAHTYTTSGLYTVGLTATNTSFSKTNSTTKTAYINATVNLDAPNADFTITETCGDIGDTFYFIDFSTGGGLYAWNWSFGDGAYSELRNPTHQYAGNGTYDVGLTVWGAYGNDTLTRSNLITIPCGAATPTPTPTVTPTGTGTPPTQEELPEGHLTPLAFVVLSFLVCGLTVYTFADNQNRNYLYIATAAVAMIVSFLLGIFLQVGTVSVDFVNTMDEVTVNESVLSTYDVQRVAITDSGFGYFFIFWGVVMLIILILAVIELFREPQRRYEE